MRLKKDGPHQLHYLMTLTVEQKRIRDAERKRLERAKRTPEQIRVDSLKRSERKRRLKRLSCVSLNEDNPPMEIDTPRLLKSTTNYQAMQGVHTYNISAVNCNILAESSMTSDNIPMISPTFLSVNGSNRKRKADESRQTNGEDENVRLAKKYIIGEDSEGSISKRTYLLSEWTPANAVEQSSGASMLDDQFSADASSCMGAIDANEYINGIPHH